MLCTANNSKRQSVYYFKTREDGELPFERNGGDDLALTGRRRVVEEDRRGSIFVELSKKEGCGLGLVLCGGHDKPNKPQISYLRPGGIAQRSDALEVGDFIVSVNGIRTGLLRHDEIVNLLKNAGRAVILEVEYELPDEPQSTLAVQYKRVEVSLEKDGATFGFTLRGGAQADPDKCRPLTVTQIRPGSSADREATLKVSDRILAIGGINTLQSNLSVALAILKNTEEDVHLLVEYDVSVMEAVQNACGPLLVEIDKTPGTSLGIFLTTSCHKGRNVICIEAVKPASIADRCGALHVGDQLLGIDETSLQHMTVAEATQLLRCGSPEHIKLEILPTRQQRKKISDTTLRSAYLTPSHQLPPSPSRSCSSLQSFGTYSSLLAAAAAAQAPPGGQYGSGGSGRSSRQQSGWPPALSHTGSANSLSSQPAPPPPSSRHDHMTSSQRTDVVLVADHRGFGFSLRGSGHPADALTAPPVVSRVEPRGAAERSGVIQEGDRVLAVNGQYLESRTLDQVNLTLRDAGLQCTLHIEFDVADAVITSAGTFTVKLVKRGATLGITISAPSKRKPGDPLIISDVKKASVAHRTGTIAPGDRLLAIDGVRTDDCTIEDAAHILQQVESIVKLKIRKDETYADEPDSSSSITYTVQLPKQGGPLGITVSGTEDPFDPVVISGLCEGGVAEKTGALHVGDRILAINSESLRGRPLSDAIHLLQTASDTVTLKISRPTNQRNRNGVAGKSHDSMDSALGSWDSSGLDNHNVLGKLRAKDRTEEADREGSCSSSLKDEGTAAGAGQTSPRASDDPWGRDDWPSQPHPQPCMRVSSETVPELQLVCGTDGGAAEGATVEPSVDDVASDAVAMNCVTTAAQVHPECEPTAAAPTLEGDTPGAEDEATVTYELDVSDVMTAVATANDDDVTSTTSTAAAASSAAAADMQLREVEEQLQNIFTPTPVELMRVRLRKTNEVDDFGFGLSDGVYEKGVYISAVRPGSEAAAALRQYDRILQVNSVKTKELDCAQVVPMIASAGNEIELVISRNPLAAFEHLQHESWQLAGPSPPTDTVYGQEV